ncbi:MAG TPA: hypothetical protein DCS93_00235 [Microscillaceae bacterium]|nr:hypothetical protein [Microscillaceae bacterium]
MKSKLILSISLIIFCLNHLKAQQPNWSEGIIIFADGYIAYGLIGKESNAIQCQFKSSLNNQVFIHKTTDLKAYAYINGAIYRKIDIDSSQAIFAKELVKGKISLYQNQDHFFAQNTTNNKLKELKPASDFKSDLAELMQDCYFKNIKRRVRKTSLSKISLIRTVNHYNSICTNLTTKDSTRLANRVSFMKSSRFELSGGLALANINFRARPYLSEATYNTPVIYSFGAFYEYLLPRSPISFKLGVVYNTNQFYDMASEVSLSNGGSVQNEMTLDVQYLTVPISVKYTFNAQKRVSPFAEIGAGIYSLQNFTSTRRQESIVNGVIITDNPLFITDDTPIKNTSIGWQLGIGTHLKIYQRLEGILKIQISQGGGFISDASFLNIQILGGVRF